MLRFWGTTISVSGAMEAGTSPPSLPLDWHPPPLSLRVRRAIPGLDALRTPPPPPFAPPPPLAGNRFPMNGSNLPLVQNNKQIIPSLLLQEGADPL